MLQQKTRYKAAAKAAFMLAAGLAVLRIFSMFLAEAIDSSISNKVVAENLLDTIFTVLSQVGVCFLIPFVIYVFYQKRSVKQVFLDANYNKVKWWVPIASIPIGIGCLFVTMFLSTLWMIIIMGFGYNYSSPIPVYPDKFNPALLMLSIFLTGVLPAICEEFAIRGNLLNAFRGSNKTKYAVLFMSLTFGLFHQHIQQVFYTAVFGGFAAFLVIKTNSIIPAMVIHFVNNSVSVLWGYGSYYGWAFFSGMDLVFSNLLGIMLALLVGGGLIIGFSAILICHSNKHKLQKHYAVLYKPTLKENAWFLGALTLTTLTTILSFAFSVY